MAGIKFRPSLTLEEIQTILLHLPEIPEHLSIINKLNIFVLKARHGITKLATEKLHITYVQTWERN